MIFTGVLCFYCYAECISLNIIMLNVIMLNVILASRNYPEHNNPERKNPNLFSGIYVKIPNVIFPQGC
jgi:hypothetical protein